MLSPTADKALTPKTARAEAKDPLCLVDLPHSLLVLVLRWVEALTRPAYQPAAPRRRPRARLQMSTSADKDEKRERKAAVKAAQREARTHKTVILAARAPAMRAPWSRVARPAPCPRALAARACPDRAPCCCCCCSAPLVLASCSSRSQSMSRRLLERGARRNRGWHAHELDCTADGRIAESQ